MALYLGKDLVSASSGLGVTIKNQDKNITENGSYSADSGYTGLGIVTVNVPVDSKIDELISRTVTEMTEKDFEGATSIGASAFRDCTALVSVVIPTTIKSIGDYAFEGCANLVIYYKGTKEEWSTVSVGTHSDALKLYYYSENEPTDSGNFWHYVDGVVTAWGEYIEPAYSEGLSYILSSGTYMVNGIGACTDTDVIIPSKIDGIAVTRINERAFIDCTNLTSITIPDSVTILGAYTFRNCTNLTSITIPASVTSIGIETFRDCTSLTSITIPASVTSIAKYAFYNCTGMQYYDFTSHTSVPTLANTNAFNSIPSDCQIRVPAALYDEWIAATNWSTYASNIVAV